MGSAEPPDPDQLPFELLLRLARREAEDDVDRPVPFLIAVLKRPIREVFDRAVKLVSDRDTTWRLLGVRILGQLGPEQPDGRRPFSAETIPLLRERLRAEPDAKALSSIVAALSTHRADEALSEVLGLATHPDAGVRFAVASGLPGLVDLAQVEPAAAEVLIRLCQDDDADIRYYALYAATREIADLDLGRIDELAARLMTDPDDQVRRMAAEHHAAIPAVRRLLNAWDFQGVFDPADNTGAYDGLIRPALVGLACYGADTAAIREVLDDEIDRRFGTKADTARMAEQLVTWWSETAMHAS